MTVSIPSEEVVTTQTLPEALATYAQENPLGTLYSFGGDTSISAREFQRASFRAARLLKQNSPPETTVGILAAYDALIHCATAFGLMSAGLIVRSSQLNNTKLSPFILKIWLV
jgi:hypothetical protein